MAFSSWQLAPGGWSVRERVTLGVVGSHLVAAVGSGSVTLADSVRDLGFDYLLEPGVEARWAREWISSVSAPLAVRVRMSRGATADTLLFLIKERG